MTSYRLIFLDLDGTLIGHDEIVSPRNIRALEDAQEAGCVIVICTGRNRHMVEPVAAQWRGHGYAILANGGVIAEWETGRVLDKVTLPGSTVPVASRLAHAAGFPLLCFGVHVDEDGGRQVYIDRRRPPIPEYAERHGHRLIYCDNLENGPDLAPVSIGVYGSHDATKLLADQWRDALSADAAVFHVPGNGEGIWCAFANARESGKAASAAKVARMLDIPREQCLAIGDHVNDIDLLTWAGLGVCMGDGHPEALACAGHVTGTFADDGVAQALERFVLGR